MERVENHTIKRLKLQLHDLHSKNQTLEAELKTVYGKLTKFECLYWETTASLERKESQLQQAQKELGEYKEALKFVDLEIDGFCQGCEGQGERCDPITCGLMTRVKTILSLTKAKGG